MKLRLWKDPLAEVEPHRLSEVDGINIDPMHADPIIEVRRMGHPDFIELMAAMRRSEDDTERRLAEEFGKEEVNVGALFAEIGMKPFFRLVSEGLVADVADFPVTLDGSDEVKKVRLADYPDEREQAMYELLSQVPGLVMAIFEWSEQKQKRFDEYTGQAEKKSSRSPRKRPAKRRPTSAKKGSSASG